jgi:hypothetical protein
LGCITCCTIAAGGALISFIFLYPACTEYETGKSAANKTLGFQTSGALNPFPIVVGERTEAQKSKDREYSSVDDNEDGIPDDQEGRARRPVPAAQQPFFIPTETGAPAAGRVERI